MLKWGLWLHGGQAQDQGCNGHADFSRGVGQLIQREIKRWRPVALNAKITAE